VKVLGETQAPVVNTREESPIWFLDTPTLIRATAESTNGAFGLIEHLTIASGFASPYHMHHNEDEAFYVLDGTIAFVCDGKWFSGGPGAYVFLPREIPHGFKVEGSSDAKLLILCSPAGFERFVLELSEPTSGAAPDMEKLIQTAAKYKIDILGPLPATT
jgi:quercetin dioxygenase-like cupin family protein